MSREPMTGPGLAVAGAVVGGAVAIAAAMGLSALARPADQAVRLAELNRKIDRIEVLRRAPADGATYPKGAVCRDGVGRGAILVEQALRADLGQARLVRVAFDPSTAVEGEGLLAVSFRFETLGSYEDAMGLLRGLDAARPTIFADSVDLVSKTSAVSLQFSGRFYCSTSARL
jgi:hypothetical protein